MAERPLEGHHDPKRAAGLSRGQDQCSCASVVPQCKKLPAGCRGEEHF